MIVRLKTTVSTMIDAAALAAKGKPHGTIVVAEEQTGGIGRHGHSWHSPGDGLYMSIILRMSLAPDALPILTMALGLAVQRAIDDLADVSCDIRWPNDVMLNEKKLAGIMVQSAERGALIAGIGVNVNQKEFPEEIRRIATSLRIETGEEHSKDALLDRIAAESMRYAAINKTEVFRQFEEHSTWVQGKAVEVEGRIRGVTAGLDEHGFLLVATDKGVERIIAGGVRPI
jgi:BirA family biotin operon repressor/biotin-[acetyl-CoA-carboxylase] ligase